MEDFKYVPTVIEINKTDFDYKDDENIIISDNIKLPNMNLGFLHNIYIFKNKYEIPAIQEKLKHNSMLKHITNNFEHSNELSNSVKKIFDMKSNIISRAFYKLWEILYYFPEIINTSVNKINCLSLGEAPCGFVQCLLTFRDAYVLNNKDTYYTISIYDKIVMNTNFKKFCSTLKPSKVFDIKTHPQNDLDKNTTNGDLTKFGTLLYLKNKFKNEKFDIITADGGFEWKNENYQEQEFYLLMLGEIINAITFQKIGGCFILKVFDIYTNITVRFIEILKTMYKKVYLIKPLMSRETNSEKYLICCDFIDNSNKDKLLNLFKKLEIKNEQQYYLHNIYNENINEMLKDLISTFNISLLNKQLVSINNHIEFINSNDYQGLKYQSYIQNQKKAIEFWKKTFLIKNKNEMEKQRIKLNNYIKEITKEIKKISI